MELRELIDSESIIVQIQWGDKAIDFKTRVLEAAKDGIYVEPHLHNNQPVELNILQSSGIQCNVFADDKAVNKRVAWKNVEVSTVQHNGETVYLITTSHFNRLSTTDERRKAARMVIHKRGRVWHEEDKRFVDIMIHDISDSGISFYAPANFVAMGSRLKVSFADNVRNQFFNMELDCKVIRMVEKPGTMFYGCQITVEQREYLMYGCLRRLIQNAENAEEKEE